MIGLVNAPFEDDLFDHHLGEPAVASPGEPTDELAHPQVFLKRPDPTEVLATNQHGRRGKSGPRACRAMKTALSLFREAGAKEVARLAEGHGGTLGLCQGGGHPPEAAGRPAVIGIEESKIFAVGGRHASIARSTDPCMLLADASDRREARLRDCKGAVTG